MAGSTPPLIQFPFMRLAPDIQLSILQSLCGHCRSETAIEIVYHDPREQTNTLSSLCLTSRYLKSLAQGILYHFPRIYSYTNFFCVIHSRPDLARCVKVLTWVYKEDVARFLYPRRLTPGKDLTPREDVWYLRALAIELKLQDTELGEFARTFAEYPQSADEDVDENFKDEMYKAFDNLVTSIMLRLCPRLELASINLQDGQEDQRIESSHREPAKFQYLPGLVSQVSFPYLRTLVIQNTLHDDPNTLGIGGISFLWKGLPNLQHLLFFRGSTEAFPGQVSPACDDRLDDAQPALRKVTELRFVHCGRLEKPLPLPAMADLVSRCPRLEDFSFSPMDLEAETFPPLQLVRAISTASSTLQHLIINCPILESSAIVATELVTDLKHFTNLQSLVLDQAVFCYHHHHPDTDASPHCLTGLLPTSIRSLTINMHSPCAPVVDLVRLGAAISNGDFSNLQHVHVQAVFGEPNPDDRSTTIANQDDNNATSGALSNKELYSKVIPACKMEIRQMVSKAFQATSVALDVACFTGYLNRPSNVNARPPHVFWPFSEQLIQDK